MNSSVLLLPLLMAFLVDGARIQRGSRSNASALSTVKDANLTGDSQKDQAMEACALVFAIEEQTGSTQCRHEKMDVDDVHKTLEKLGGGSVTLPEGFTCGRGYECENAEGEVRNVLAGSSPAVCGTRSKLQAWKTCIAIDERSFSHSLSDRVVGWWSSSNSSNSTSQVPVVPTPEAPTPEAPTPEAQAAKPIAAKEHKKGKEIVSMDADSICDLVFQNNAASCRTPQMLRKDVEKYIKPQKLPEGITCQRGYECEGRHVVAGNSPAFACHGATARRVCIPLELGTKSFLKRLLGK